MYSATVQAVNPELTEQASGGTTAPMTRAAGRPDSGGRRLGRLLEVNGGTRRGDRRARNEDEIAWFAGGRIIALADGMGERPHGGLASSVVMTEVRRFVETRDLIAATGHAGAGGSGDASAGAAIDALDVMHAVRWIRDTFAACRDRLASAQATVARQPAMESALMLALITGPQLVLGHVGHSRCYRWRAGTLTQLTRDHRRAPAGIDQLEDDERRALRSPVCVANRGVGDELGDDPEITAAEISDGDVILLCSNGLSDAIAQGVLVDALHPELDAASMVSELLEAADRGRAEDDASAIVVRVGPWIVGAS
jgi:PPM family protein phosphatase